MPAWRDQSPGDVGRLTSVTSSTPTPAPAIASCLAVVVAAETGSGRFRPA